MERQTIQWTVSLPPPLSKEALKVAKKEYRTRSELVREALRRYLENSSLDRIRRKISKRLGALGIKNDRDIERLIDDER
jgi:metal-responsive CopG/Arc/MetJ family transcriptional regulator